MNWELLAWIALGVAAIPAALTLINLPLYRSLPRSKAKTSPLSVLIPARNEATNLRPTLDAVLANDGVEFEVVILDDHSTDGTAEIVKEYAARDGRVRLEHAPALPSGWCGKPHACHVLAQRARYSTLVFIDADVRIAPDALARLSGRFLSSDAALISGVPCQELGTFSERLLLPLIHFVLLGYLPLWLMRWTKMPAFSAGCGQLIAVRRTAYVAVGGHAPICATLHDGVKMPRLFRRHGFKTELFDATDLATCRMYRSAEEVWSGLGKNATEGLAAPGAILPMTAMLLAGQVLPFLLLLRLPYFTSADALVVAAAVALAWLPRFIAVWRFRQPLGSALLHPVGVLLLLVIQWLALGRQVAGKPSVWKGRQYHSATKSA